MTCWSSVTLCRSPNRAWCVPWRIWCTRTDSMPPESEPTNRSRSSSRPCEKGEPTPRWAQSGQGEPEFSRSRNLQEGLHRVLIELENVTKFFGGLSVLSDVSFGVEEGEIGGLIGPNGA